MAFFPPAPFSGLAFQTKHNPVVWTRCFQCFSEPSVIKPSAFNCPHTAPGPWQGVLSHHLHAQLAAPTQVSIPPPEAASSHGQYPPRLSPFLPMLLLGLLADSSSTHQHLSVGTHFWNLFSPPRQIFTPWLFYPVLLLKYHPHTENFQIHTPT